MPPPLALLLCTAFVLFLLVLERRVSRHISSALWIPTLWMLLIASKPLAVWFGERGDNETGSALDRLVLTVLGVAAVAVLARRRFNWSGPLRRHGWLLVMLVYALVSTLWSDIPLIALRRWMRELIIVPMGLVILSEANPREALESLLRRSAYVLIPFSLMLIKYYPALGLEYGRWSGIGMWTGVTNHKNSLGRMCAIAAIFLLVAFYRRWRARGTAGGPYNNWADLSILFLALYLLKGADGVYSATSVGAFAIGITTFMGLVWCRKLNLRVPLPVLRILTIFLIGIGTSTPFSGGSDVAGFTSFVGRDETLTGRTEVWAALVPVVKRQPLLGAGFGSFWTTARREEYQIPHGHNGYLDILLEEGAVGLALTTVWLLSCTRKLQTALAKDYDGASLGICFLLMALMCNFTETVLSSLTEQVTAVLTLASFVASYKPVHSANRMEFRSAFARNAAASIGAATDWHPRETRPQFRRNSSWT
jgi:exopolysaccharide production protein ExoQ